MLNYLTLKRIKVQVWDPTDITRKTVTTQIETLQYPISTKSPLCTENNKQTSDRMCFKAKTNLSYNQSRSKSGNR
jgi:hypothetical protein